jgi:hypothetical protein
MSYNRIAYKPVFWAIHIFIGCSLLGLLAMTCFASDKSGVKPNTISLPSGPGSIEGLGESFQPTLNTGTAKYRVQLTVPPGVAGHTVNLSLVYEGGNGNGPLGFGWRINTPFIERQSDKGIPRYVDGNNGRDDDGDGVTDEPDEIDIFINEIREELVPNQEATIFVRMRVLLFAIVALEIIEGKMPDGTLLVFGLSPSARIVDNLTGRVYRWMLENRLIQMEIRFFTFIGHYLVSKTPINVIYQKSNMAPALHHGVIFTSSASTTKHAPTGLKIAVQGSLFAPECEFMKSLPVLKDQCFLDTQPAISTTMVKTIT